MGMFDDLIPSAAPKRGGPVNLPALAAQEGLSPSAAGVAAGIYQQESRGGRNTKTSNAGAVGGMQIIPATFARFAKPGEDINNPEHNARAALRYIKALDAKAGGDPRLIAAGYYGGEGAIPKARNGVAVSDPRNPSAPNTLQYADQVVRRAGAQASVQAPAPQRAPVTFDDLIPAAQTQKPQASGILQNLAEGAMRGAAGVGNFVLSPVRAAANAMAPKSEVAQYLNRMEATPAEFDAQHAESAAYSVGRTGAEIGMTLPIGGAIGGLAKAAAPVARMLPGTARLATPAANVVRAIETGGTQGGGLLSRSVGSAVNGAAAGAILDPGNAGQSAAFGAAVPGVFGAAGRVARAASGTVRPNPVMVTLADAAINRHGIPLGIADITGSTATKALRSVLNDAPLIGAVGAKQRDGVQQAFNRAVGRTFGADAASLTPEVLDQAKTRIGGELDRIWGGNSIKVDGQLWSELGEHQAAAAKLPANEGGSILREIDDLMSKMVQAPDGSLSIPGDVANKFQSYLRRRAEGATGIRHELGDLRKTVIGGFNRSVNGDDAAALKAAMGQYKNLKTVSPLLDGAALGVAGRSAGDVPAALLPGAVRTSYGSGAGTDLGELSAIGSHFLADRVARTGGSTRAAIQNGAIGSGLALGAYTNPATLFAAPAAAGINALLGAPGLGRWAARRAMAPAGLLGRSSTQSTLARAAPAGLLGMRSPASADPAAGYMAPSLLPATVDPEDDLIMPQKYGLQATR